MRLSGQALEMRLDSEEEFPAQVIVGWERARNRSVVYVCFLKPIMSHLRCCDLDGAKPSTNAQTLPRGNDHRPRHRYPILLPARHAARRDSRDWDQEVHRIRDIGLTGLRDLLLSDALNRLRSLRPATTS
jgi:hypothetical protein